MSKHLGKDSDDEGEGKGEEEEDESWLVEIDRSAGGRYPRLIKGLRPCRRPLGGANIGEIYVKSRILLLPYMAAGRVWCGAKCPHGV